MDVVWGTVCDKDLVAQCMQGADIVFHLGAKINVDRSKHIPYVYASNNVMGTATVMSEIHRLKDKVDMIHASTCEIYGSNLFGSMHVLEAVKRFNPQAQHGGVHMVHPYARLRLHTAP